MDPASEELERRSRYLSSLIRRTKLGTAPASAPPPPPPLPEPEPALAAPNPQPEPEPAVGRREREEAKPAPLAVVEEKEKREVKEEEEVGAHGKGKEIKGKDGGGGAKEENSRKVSVRVRVRAADMPLPLQRRAIRLAYEAVAAMPRLDSKRLALALKKEFDTAYGPAWHCIVGTSFGSYVTHSLGGFLYFSVDKAYILLFRTAVEPLGHPR